MMTNEQRTLAAAKAYVEFLKHFTPAPKNSRFDIGPSDEDVANMHLSASVVQPEKMTELVTAMDKAIKESDVAKLNAVLDTIEHVAGPLLKVFGL